MSILYIKNTRHAFANLAPGLAYERLRARGGTVSSGGALGVSDYLFHTRLVVLIPCSHISDHS